jgi:hypothetical protein
MVQLENNRRNTMAKAKQVVEQVQEPKVAETKEVKAPRITIASLIIEKIKEGKMSNEQIKDYILVTVPKAKTTYACIAWYRTKLRKEGVIGERVYAKKPKAEEPKAA